ncbi:MAG: CHAT domain-containing tetratricopeptide repeat protein [Acidobacteriota bacterium]
MVVLGLASGVGWSQGTATVCAPVADRPGGHFVPAFPAGTIPETLAASLATGYKQFYELKQVEAAAKTLIEARKDAVAAQNTCAEALAVEALGDAAEQRRFNDAEELFRTALKLFEGLGSSAGAARAHYGLALGYSYKGNYKDAATEFWAANRFFEASGDRYQALYTKVAAKSAERDVDYGALLAEARADNYPCIGARIEEDWASRLHRVNHFDEEMPHLQHADALYAVCPEHENSRAGVQTAMGRLERQLGRAPEALKHYKVALALQIKSGDVSLVPQTYNAMGVAHDAMLDFAHSIPLYKKGIEYARQIHSQPFVDFISANLAHTYVKAGQPALALPILEAMAAKASTPFDLCVRHWQLGDAYMRTGAEEKAIAESKLTIPLCRADNQSLYLIEALNTSSAAKVSLRMYDDALADSKEALSLLEEAEMHMIPEDAYKQGFTDEQSDTYDTTIKILTAQNKASEALEVAEEARARGFLDLLESRKIAESSKKPAGPKLTPEQARKDLIASPEHLPPLTVTQILESAGRLHSTVISYWLTKDALYVWMVRPGEPVFEVLQPVTAARLEHLVAESHRAPKLDAAESTAWRSLYRLLIAPVAQHLPQKKGELLTIVPAGPLFTVSFAALREPGAAGKYLVERYRIHTVPSMGLLAFTERNLQAANAKPEHLLVVAHPVTTPGVDGRALPELPGTENELKAISRGFTADEVTRLEGRKASVSELTAALPQATMVHFATHAVLNESAPYASFLALDDAEHAGRLSVADIYRLHVSARLVVLSACKTGLGKISGDGVSGMSRAFFYAGAARVLTTLWDISDQPTSRMMPRFYAELQRGASPSDALRNAQLATLRDLRAGKIHAETVTGVHQLRPDPSFWAGFSLSGEP